MNEWERLLEAARKAKAGGATDAQINASINRRTGGQYKDMAGLESAITSDPLTGKGPSFGRDMLRSAAQGATFGFADELAGIGAAMVPGGRNRQEATAASRGRMERIREEHPVAAPVAEILGGLVVPGGTGLKVGKSVLRATGNRIAAGVAGGGVGGLLGGAVTGAGEADSDLSGRAAGAAIGGGVGAVTGGLLGAGGAAAGRVIERAGGMMGSARAHAGATLDRALGDAGIFNPDEIAARVRGLGPGSVVADLSPNLGREARAAANQAPGLAAETGPIRNLERRAAARGERIAGDLRGSSGLTRTYEASLEAAEQALDDARVTHYRPLEDAFPVVDGANVRAALADSRIAPIVRQVAPDVAQGKRAPSFRELQDIMMDAKDNMTAARAAGRPNASQKAGEAFGLIEGAMKQDIPGFADAQDAYSIASRRIAAHDLGRKAAMKAPSDIRAEIAALPEEARDAFRQGMLDRFESQLRERTGGGGKAVSMINAGTEMQDRLRQIVADDPGMQSLLSSLEREARWSRTWNALSGGSTTAQQTNDIFAQIPLSKQGIMTALMSNIVGLGANERIAAAEIIGRVLMSDGESAARIMAQEIGLRTSRAAIGGAVGGTAAAQELTQ